MKKIILTLFLILSFASLAKAGEKKCTFSYTVDSLYKVYETDSGEGIYKHYATWGSLILGNLFLDENPSNNWIDQGETQTVECGVPKVFFLSIVTRADKLRLTLYVNAKIQNKIDLYKGEDFSESGSGQYFYVYF